MPWKDFAFIFKGAMLGVRDPKVADRVPNRVRHRLVLVNPIQTVIALVEYVMNRPRPRAAAMA